MSSGVSLGRPRCLEVGRGGYYSLRLDLEEKLLNYSRFSKRPENFRAGQRINVLGINLYVETHGDSRTLQKFMTQLIADFGCYEDYLTFEIFI